MDGERNNSPGGPLSVANNYICIAYTVTVAYAKLVVKEIADLLGKLHNLLD